MSGDQTTTVGTMTMEMAKNPSSDHGGGNNDHSSGNYNPMLNPVVLQRLFALCALEDLRRFRQVCTLWNEVALRRWRNQMTVSIYPYQPYSYSSFGEKLTFTTSDQIFMPPFDAMPYRSYRLLKYDFPFPLDSLGNMTIGRFLVSNGAWMRELTLEEAEIEDDNVVALKRLIFELTPNLKLLALRAMLSDNLVEFFLEDLLCRNYNDDIDDNNEHQEEEREEVDVIAEADVVQQLNLKILKVSLHPLINRLSDWFPVSWREYLVHFPNVERIEMGNLDADRIQTFVEVLEGNEGLGAKIKQLDLQDTKLEVWDIRRILSVPQLQLDELHVQIPLEDDLDWSDDDDLGLLVYRFRRLRLEMHNGDPELPYPCPVELQSFVFEQAPILHTLHLKTNCSDDHEARLRFFHFHVSMDALTKLVLRGNMTSNWNFLNNTPNLKTVHIFKFNLNNMFLKESYKDVEELGVRCPCLEELRLKSVKRKHKAANIAEKIPSHTVKFIAKCMPNLKVLEAPLANETFRLVCQNWMELRELHDSSSNLTDYGITGIRPFWKVPRRLPNITQLKCLEAFSTKSEHLTDASVTQGFLQLPLLHTVDAPKSTLISFEAEEDMRRRFSWYWGISYRDREMDSISQEELEEEEEW